MTHSRRLGILIWLAASLGMWLMISIGNAEEDVESGMNQHHHMEATETMASPQIHADPHMRLTNPRPPTPEDQQRAEQILQALRASLEKYKDYRVALEDHYKPFLPKLPLPRYHFTNYWYGFKGAFKFDPAKPTSLIYRKTKDGYELLGAMYTAPKRATEEQLNERVPLSVAQWHAHVNVCLPPKDNAKRADWKKFGLKGSIATEDVCQEAGGTFYPQIFGWMVHVSPFESTPDKIWAH